MHWCWHRRPESIPGLPASLACVTGWGLAGGGGRCVSRGGWESWRVRARDQLEAELWGLREADGCVGFGSQRLCKTRLAGLRGLASQVGLCRLPGLRCLCVAGQVFLEALEAEWHIEVLPVTTPHSGQASPHSAHSPLSQMLV